MRAWIGSSTPSISTTGHSTKSSTSLRLQLPWHGAGQTRPIMAGNGLAPTMRENADSCHGMPANGEMKMTIAAKWLGPCAADQKPGDMIMSNGMKINIRNMPSMGGGMPRH